jgi:hypothetical protein
MDQVTINIWYHRGSKAPVILLALNLVRGPDIQRTITETGEWTMIEMTIRSTKSTVKIRRLPFKSIIERFAEYPGIRYVAYRFFDAKQTHYVGREADSHTDSNYIKP